MHVIFRVRLIESILEHPAPRVITFLALSRFLVELFTPRNLVSRLFQAMPFFHVVRSCYLRQVCIAAPWLPIEGPNQHQPSCNLCRPRGANRSRIFTAFHHSDHNSTTCRCCNISTSPPFLGDFWLWDRMVGLLLTSSVSISTWKTCGALKLLLSDGVCALTKFGQ